jgi:hypothetical protein
MSTDGRYRCCRFFVSKELDAHPIGGGKFFDKAIRENTAGEFLWWGLLVEGRRWGRIARLLLDRRNEHLIASLHLVAARSYIHVLLN